MYQEKKGPTIVIVGSGLAGLLTSLNIQEVVPSAYISVIEKDRPQSNTQIAGMRFRQKKSGSIASNIDSYAEDIVQLLAEKNSNVLLPQMVDFAYLAVNEIIRLNNVLREVDPDLVSENNSWFGPQWGKTNQSGEGGRGSSVLHVLRRMALAKGIQLITGEVTRIQKYDRVINGISYLDEGLESIIEADAVILANGNAGGALYESTNKVITNSATELVFQAGLPIEGGTLNMWHPFSRCSSDGQSRNGCFETDSLAGAQVWLGDGTFDEETTQLLAEHQGHYHFDEISRRFIEHGSTTKIVLPSGETLSARVSLHYSHLGAQTIDGSRVKGTDNLFAVGDAGGFLYWSGHKPRLPGFALTHCLVSARHTAIKVHEIIESDHRSSQKNVEGNLKGKNLLPRNKELRKINTRFATELDFGSTPKGDILSMWENEVRDTENNEIISAITLGIIDAWTKKIHGEQEPISLKKEGNLDQKERELELSPLRKRL